MRKNKSNKVQVVLMFIGFLIIPFLVFQLPKIRLFTNKIEAASTLSFPSDHGQHGSFFAEWWYLNLMVKAKNPSDQKIKDLGYVLSFSRISGVKSLLTSRYDDSSKNFKENTNSGGNLTVNLINGKYLYVKYLNGIVSMMLEEKPPGLDRKKNYKLTGSTPEIGSFDLTLKERTVIASGSNSPLLWGGVTGNCRGKISVFGLDDTFYYSIPDLDISGFITDTDGVSRSIEVGKAWIDHQWFNSTPPANWKGHYWNSLHLTTSGNLYDNGPHNAVGFVTQIYSNGPKYTYWVKRNSDGTNECGVGGGLSVDSYGNTGYPSKWQIELNKSNSIFMRYAGYPFSSNQIFDPPAGPNFYEPVSFYSGNVGGSNFTGLGFFETHLTRYSAIVKNNSTLSISAYGTKGNNVYPQMDILIDDKKVKTYTVSGIKTDYNYVHPNALNAEQIKVRFSNDYYQPPDDRNLFVDKITLNGFNYQTEANTTYSIGSWNNEGCSPGFKKSEWLSCNGYFHYLFSFY
jgi:hypothetical protein